MAEMTPLRRRMIEDMSIRNLSPVTQRCYLHAVTSFSRHFMNCPPVICPALSVAMAWLYAHTNRSLLLAILMHSAINQSKDIVPSARSIATNPFALNASLVAWLTIALLWISAGYFLVRMSKAEASRT